MTAPPDECCRHESFGIIADYSDDKERDHERYTTYTEKFSVVSGTEPGDNVLNKRTRPSSCEKLKENGRQGHDDRQGRVTYNARAPIPECWAADRFLTAIRSLSVPVLPGDRQGVTGSCGVVFFGSLQVVRGRSCPTSAAAPQQSQAVGSISRGLASQDIDHVLMASMRPAFELLASLGGILSAWSA
jgi:hypothetical protein